LHDNRCSSENRNRRRLQDFEFSTNKSLCEPRERISSLVFRLAKNMNMEPSLPEIPERIIITYQKDIYETAKQLIDGERLDFWMYNECERPFCIGQYNDVSIGLGLFWLGASAAAMTLEEAIACGAKKVFEIGRSAGLQPFLHQGDIIVVTEAIRDEGTSNHYLRRNVRVESSRKLETKLVENLDNVKAKYFVGQVWSTDGFYRETIQKYRKFKKKGILAVNMETSAIFAVSKYRSIEVASGQVISDTLSETGWSQSTDRQPIEKKTKILLTSTLEAISQI